MWEPKRRSVESARWCACSARCLVAGPQQHYTLFMDAVSTYIIPSGMRPSKRSANGAGRQFVSLAAELCLSLVLAA
ncbi:hypothetical protein CHLRE_09g389902v5 [Chlamydomonas reinhardtii]|uniref:Uncharacterized protein n=1 Tax=Chlamydomonas reinhardtii TaxID=3055 RepID=A0A2K3DDL3_CHLRE|nr:uncharacterized protein CHLRE_09g389902v5 [Chlamydomonas reinhardtii]PNW78614.1 hypothetical protein CHLRE_09g389902v5 [Chlamydomonas reinhardtii]